MRVTQLHIAREVGVSQQAVAFALSQNPASHKQLNPTTRTRIFETAQRLGYVPHHAGRRLARTRTTSRSNSFDQVGLINLAPGQARLDPVCLAMLSGAEFALSKFDASLTFVHVRQEKDWSKVDRLMGAEILDGWLVYGPVDDAAVDRLKRTGLPFVILGDHASTQPVSGVNVDNDAVGRLAAQHFASLGHRQIAYASGSMNLIYQERTLAGFRAARRELGLDDDPGLITNLGHWSDLNARRLLEWMQAGGSMATALFLPDYGTAPWIHRMIVESPFPALKQTSLLTSCFVLADDATYSMPYIELPMIEVGSHGAALLHQVVSGARREPSELKISPTLIEGAKLRPT